MATSTFTSQTALATPVVKAINHLLAQEAWARDALELHAGKEALIDAWSFNVQDRNWLVYCALGGHQHHDLPDMDLHTGFSFLDFYQQAA